MSKRILRFAFTATMIFLFGACDKFSLFDQFHDSWSLNLVLQRPVAEQGESISLFPSGGKEPYSYAIIENDLFYVGDTASATSSTNQLFTAGNSVGRVTIRLIDSKGHVADAIITILPPIPQNFELNNDVSWNEIDMYWDYTNTALISYFRIERTFNSEPFSELASVGSLETDYKDKNLTYNREYTYRIYAVAGEYNSLSSPELTSKP